ncbi:hypothetical protein FHW36_104269 [Chitinophaga polysaccharea]|uniref:Uncharacterized protein n=1 Tax=Chitinophaga polysaccharea TaxID=1293035 RepID=A0A561PR35_9BACT|nr:hypothetical protein [Chitinophaga polysaccharea]TWF40586.1 hypothetical protein FHW36_104269 [Chitinophaga polysaccharea]
MKPLQIFSICFFLIPITTIAQSKDSLPIVDLIDTGGRVLKTVNFNDRSFIRLVDGLVDSSQFAGKVNDWQKIRNEDFNKELNLEPATKPVLIINTPNTPFEDYIYDTFSYNFLYNKVNGKSYYTKKPIMINGILISGDRIKSIVMNSQTKSNIQDISYIQPSKLDLKIRSIAPFGVISIKSKDL